MLERTLPLLRCPTSKTQLQLSGDTIPIRTADTPAGTDILEGMLVSKEGNIYPIIAGVAILLSNPFDYVAKTYTQIMNIAGRHISDDLLGYLRENSYDIAGGERTSIADTERNLGAYLFAHYENLYHYVPPENPIRKLIDGENWYSQLLNTLEDHVNPDGYALDMGCHVGGVTWRLAQLYGYAIGIDRGFPAIYTARQIHVGQPEARKSYRVQIEGAVFRERELAPEPVDNIDFLVASALSLNFVPKTFDVITGINLIDTVSSPQKLLQIIFQELKLGGLMLLSDPYTWGINASPIESWLYSSKDVHPKRSIQTTIQRMFDILDEQDNIPWLLHNYDRGYRLYINHQMLCQKPGKPN